MKYKRRASKRAVSFALSMVSPKRSAPPADSLAAESERSTENIFYKDDTTFSAYRQKLIKSYQKLNQPYQDSQDLQPRLFDLDGES